MKQQLIDRNECLKLINQAIDELEDKACREKSPDIYCKYVNAMNRYRYIRTNIVAKMPIVEEREVKECV